MSEKLLIKQMQTLQSGFEGIKERQSTLEQKVDANHTETSSRLEKLEDTVGSLDSRTHKLGLQLEEYGSKQDLTLEIVMSNQRQIMSFAETRTSVIDHEHRLSAVEYFVRKHPN